MKKKTKSLVVSFVLAFTLLFSAPVALASFKTDSADAATDSTALTAEKVFTYSNEKGKNCANYKVIPADNNLGTAYDTPDKFVPAFKGNSIYVPLGKKGDLDNKGEATSMTFDISDNTKDDVLLEWKPAGDWSGALRTYLISIIDSTDTSKKIDLYFRNTQMVEDNTNWYGYIGTAPVAYEHDVSTDLYVTANGLAQKGGHFDGEWSVARTAAMTSNDNTNGADATTTQKIYYDHSEKAIYADVLVWDETNSAVKTEKKLVRDLDATDATNGNESAWSGFTSSNVYIAISHDSGSGGKDAHNSYGFLVREIDGIKMGCDENGAITDAYKVAVDGSNVVYTQSAYLAIADNTGVAEGDAATIQTPVKKADNQPDTEGWTVTVLDADGNDVTKTNAVSGLGDDNAFQENATVTLGRGTTVVTLAKADGSETVTQRFVVGGLKQVKVTVNNQKDSTVTLNGTDVTGDYTDADETTGATIVITEGSESKLTEAKVNGVVKTVTNGTITLTYAELKYKTDIELTFADVYKMTLKEGDTVLGEITAAQVEAFVEANAYALVKRNGYTVAYKYNDAAYAWDTASSANIEVSVEYTAINYTVETELDGGTIASGATMFDTVTVEDDITLPAVEKDGYTFAGWYTDARFVNALTDGVFANAYEFADSDNKITLYARLTLDEYVLNYETNGGKLTGAYDYYYTVEDLSVTLPNATKDGYYLSAWKMGDVEIWCSTSSTKEYTFNASELGDKTITAVWSAQACSVIFTVDSSKGDVTGETSGNFTIDGATELTFPTVTAKTHYSFVGWTINGTDVFAADEFDYDNYADSVTIAAVFENVRYAIVYAGCDGAEFGENDYVQYVTVDSVGDTIAADDLPEVSKAGYTFGGWKLNGADFTSVTVVETHLAQNGLTITAQFTPITYTLTLNANGGTVSAGNKTTTFTVEDTEIELPDAALGTLKFMGWYTSMSALPGERVVAGEYTFPAHDLTLYAKYDNENYNVTYIVDGDVFATENVAKHATITKIASSPVKAGYTFEGWCVDGAAYTFGAPATADVTLTAKFVATKYQIVLEGNGAELANNTVEFTVESTSITLPTPEREGYTFVGWFEGSTKIDPATYALTAGNKTFEARWTQNAAKAPVDTEGCASEAVGLLAVVLSALAAVLVIKKK